MGESGSIQKKKKRKINTCFCVAWCWSSTDRVNENIPIKSSMFQIRFLEIKNYYWRKVFQNLAYNPVSLFLRNISLRKRGATFCETFSGIFERWETLPQYRNHPDIKGWQKVSKCYKELPQELSVILYICVIQKWNKCPFFYNILLSCTQDSFLLLKWHSLHIILYLFLNTQKIIKLLIIKQCLQQNSQALFLFAYSPAA